MTRWPVFLTLAGGRSNAISRVPRPGFVTPMKGVTGMQAPQDGPPWTPQRTRALFRLFQASAPPDFQHQILARLDQRQYSQGRRGWRMLLAWWAGEYPGGGETHHAHRRWPGPVIAMVWGCGLVLGTSLTWWVWMDPAASPTPGQLSRLVALQSHPPIVSTAAPLHSDYPGQVGRAAPLEPAGHTAEFPESGVGAARKPTGASVDAQIAAQEGGAVARVLRTPVPGAHLTVQKERQPPTRRPPERSGRPRREPGKTARPHIRPGASPQVPG
jgi:hypothetical protein